MKRRRSGGRTSSSTSTWCTARAAGTASSSSPNTTCAKCGQSRNAGSRWLAHCKREENTSCRPDSIPRRYRALHRQQPISPWREEHRRNSRTSYSKSSGRSLLRSDSRRRTGDSTLTTKGGLVLVLCETPDSPCNQRRVFVAEVLNLRDRKSTRLNSSHRCISYAVF